MIMDSPVMIPDIYRFTSEDIQYIYMDLPVRLRNINGFTCEDSQ